ncbi:MAG: hypothetical protein OEV77_11965 [Nitrospira sp.]|nr:hypothetical protein [Nitrospira sp.]
MKGPSTPLRSPTQAPDVSDDLSGYFADVHIPSVGVGLLCKKGGSRLGLVSCGDIGLGPVTVKAIGLDVSYHASLYEPRVREKGVRNHCLI